MAIRAIIKRRLDNNAVVFPEESTGATWRDPIAFDKAYSRALKDAARAAGIETKVDCRIGRRTCASILIRAGRSTEEVAACFRWMWTARRLC